MGKIQKVIQDPLKGLEYLFYKYNWLSRPLTDEMHIKLMYFLGLRKRLNLENPKTFNEKIQWLKLYDKNPEYIQLVDKYAVKEYIGRKVGMQYVVQNYGVWESVEDIDFNALPQQFVLKCTHDCGGIVICKDKSKLDIPYAKKKLSNALKKKYYMLGREWPYAMVKPRIIAEEYLEDSKTLELRDYKFFTFNGAPRIMFVASDRQKSNEKVKFDFFDMQYKHLTMVNGHDNAAVCPDKPQSFEAMKRLAAVLSEDIPHVRVDFYEVDGRVYVGELTFYHFSGFVPFEPEEWDLKLGQWLELPGHRMEN